MMELLAANQGRLRRVAQVGTIKAGHDFIKSIWSEATMDAVSLFGDYKEENVKKCYDNILRKQAEQSAAAGTDLDPTHERKPTLTICRRETDKL